MALDRFRCYTESGYDLCFNGGVCSNQSTEDVQFCVCPSGWGGDRMWFHQDNCTMPEYALLALFLFNTLLSVFCLYKLYAMRSVAKERVRTILNLASIFVITFDLEILTLFVENGWFIGMSIATAMTVVTTCYWGYHMVKLFITPIVAVEPKLLSSITRLAYVCLITIAAVTIGPCLGLAISAYINPIPFNIIMMVYMLATVVFVAFFAISISYYGRELIQRIGDRDIRTKDTVRHKLSAVQSGLIAFVLGRLPLVAACVVFWCIGSVPFLWVILFIALPSTPYSITKATLGLLKENEKDSKRSSKNMKSSFSKTSRDSVVIFLAKE
jgi:hypothetical protein